MMDKNSFFVEMIIQKCSLYEERYIGVESLGVT